MYGGSVYAGPHKTTVAPPRPDPIPNPFPNPNPNPLGGWRSSFEVGRGSMEFTCQSLLARTCNSTPGGIELIFPPPVYSYYYFFPSSHLLSSHYSRPPSLPPSSSNLDPGPRSGPSSPLPTTAHVPPFLSREASSFFFPRRLASNCTYPRCVGALSSWKGVGVCS